MYSYVGAARWEIYLLKFYEMAPKLKCALDSRYYCPNGIIYIDIDVQYIASNCLSFLAISWVESRVN